MENLIKILKINHYIKNLVVFVPLILSLSFVDVKQTIFTIVIFVASCLMSSCVYIVNDIIDLESDKKHPIKCKRPLASGRVSIKLALVIFFILFIFSILCSIQININCTIVVLLYFVLNIFYSFYLKKLPLIDASCIALGFILRILAGCCAISALPSALVILMTFFISNFFTFAKRKLEIETNADKRSSLKDIDLNTIKQFVLINAVLSVSFYITYVLDDSTIERVGTNYLYLTVIPFTLIIYRLFLLINTTKIADDPIIYIEQDKTLKY